MLERIGQLVAVLTSTVIVLSIVYDFSYFQVIDGNLFRLLSLSDHVSAAVEQLPKTGTYLVIGLIVTLYPTKQELAGMPMNEDRQLIIFDNEKWFVARPTMRTKFAIAWTVIIVLIWAVLPMKSAWATAYLFLMLIWLPKVFRPISNRLRGLGYGAALPFLYHAIFFLGVAYCLGALSAYVDLGRKEPRYEVHLSSTPSEALRVNILRATSFGLLVRDPIAPGNRLLSWSDVHDITRVEPKEPARKGLVCRLTGYCGLDDLSL